MITQARMMRETIEEDMQEELRRRVAAEMALNASKRAIVALSKKSDALRKKYGV